MARFLLSHQGEAMFEVLHPNRCLIVAAIIAIQTAFVLPAHAQQMVATDAAAQGEESAEHTLVLWDLVW
jgi:hypothetical protein